MYEPGKEIVFRKGADPGSFTEKDIFMGKDITSNALGNKYIEYTIEKQLPTFLMSIQIYPNSDPPNISRLIRKVEFDPITKNISVNYITQIWEYVFAESDQSKTFKRISIGDYGNVKGFLDNGEVVEPIATYWKDVKSYDLILTPVKIMGYPPDVGWYPCAKNIDVGLYLENRTVFNNYRYEHGAIPSESIGSKIIDFYISERESRPCIRDGGWSDWSAWKFDKYDAITNKKYEIRTRTCTNPAPENGGKDCIGEKVEYKCVPTPGYYTDWEETKSCNVDCGKGVKTLSRKYIKAECGGNDLPNEPLEKEVACEKQPCVFNPDEDTGPMDTPVDQNTNLVYQSTNSENDRNQITDIIPITTADDISITTNDISETSDYQKFPKSIESDFPDSDGDNTDNKIISFNFLLFIIFIIFVIFAVMKLKNRPNASASVAAPVV